MDSNMGDTEAQSRPSRARTLCDLGRFADAVSEAAAAIAEDPRDASAWCVMAEAQLGSERAAAALQAAEAAASLQPELEQPHRLASLALSRLGRDQEAAQAAFEATQRDPASWQAHAHLARSLAAFRNRLGEARWAAERALALGPDQSGPHLAAGAVAVAAGRQAEATAAFCAALGADPHSAEAHSRLAEMPDRRRADRIGSVMRRIAERLPRPAVRRRRHRWPT